MLHGPWLILWLALWYSGLAFWIWRYGIVIKSGNAGTSGVPLSKSEKPIRFWLTVVWEGLMLVAFASFPLVILLKSG